MNLYEKIRVMIGHVTAFWKQTEQLREIASFVYKDLKAAQGKETSISHDFQTIETYYLECCFLRRLVDLQEHEEKALKTVLRVLEYVDKYALQLLLIPGVLAPTKHIVLQILSNKALRKEAAFSLGYIIHMFRGVGGLDVPGDPILRPRPSSPRPSPSYTQSYEKKTSFDDILAKERRSSYFEDHINRNR